MSDTRIHLIIHLKSHLAFRHGHRITTPSKENLCAPNTPHNTYTRKAYTKQTEYVRGAKHIYIYITMTTPL